MLGSLSILSDDQPGVVDDGGGPGSVDGMEPYALQAPPLPLAGFISFSMFYSNRIAFYIFVRQFYVRSLCLF